MNFAVVFVGSCGNDLKRWSLVILAYHIILSDRSQKVPSGPPLPCGCNLVKHILWLITKIYTFCDFRLHQNDRKRWKTCIFSILENFESSNWSKWVQFLWRVHKLPILNVGFDRLKKYWFCVILDRFKDRILHQKTCVLPQYFTKIIRGNQLPQLWNYLKSRKINIFWIGQKICSI